MEEPGVGMHDGEKARDVEAVAEVGVVGRCDLDGMKDGACVVVHGNVEVWVLRGGAPGMWLPVLG